MSKPVIARLINGDKTEKFEMLMLTNIPFELKVPIFVPSFSIYSNETASSDNYLQVDYKTYELISALNFEDKIYVIYKERNL